MSSLASLFNSSASLFTVDVYQKLRPGHTPEHYLWVGRVATAVTVGFGMLWIPVMKLVSTGGLYQYLQNVQGYMAPPICAVFILGLFWKRINSAGAVWGLGGGFVIGMLKLTIQTFYGAEVDKIHNPAWLAAIGDFSWLYSTGVLFVISSIIIIVASYMTEPPPKEKTEGLTYGTLRNDPEVKASWDKGNTILACIVIGIVLSMYLYFSFWLC
jgi:SSS family solute:Na+ symporter